MLLGILGASLLGNLLTGKGILRAGSGKGILRAGSGRPLSSALQNKKGKGIVRAGSARPSCEKKRKRNCKSWYRSSFAFCFPK